MEETLKEILETLRVRNKIEKTTFSVKEAATYLGVGHEKIRELVSRKETDFPYFRVGVRVSIDKKSLDNWIEKITEEHRVI
ncbi:helix-turn-helix domain-containing protein [Clostridium cagae]|uniref:helix-turn-helix domain-containing protein n=1 Tax=Clostridium cagae TaxID=2080751 RepID=UPI003F75D432